MNWANYSDVLAEMRVLGLVVDDLDVGKLRRCKVEGEREKRGWYSLHELRLDDGATVLVGTYGINRGADHGTQKIDLAAWLKGAKRDPMTDDQKRALKARIEEDRRAAERVRKARASRAALLAQKAWSLMQREGDSPYLKRKGVQAHGVRFSRDGREVIVPLLDTSGRIHGLQRIYPDKAKGGRDKDFWPAGLAKQGHFFQLGPQPTSVLLVAEGYATAASLFEASGWPVFVAWDAGNLAPVAEALAKRYRGVKILVCADDDYLTEGNPGISKASAAALTVNGAWLAPEFASDRAGKKITDFNDLHALEGLHQVRAQVEAKLRQLGWGQAAVPAAPRQPVGEGGEENDDLQNVETVEELQARFSLVYELPDSAFDAQESKLVPLSSVRNICASRVIYRIWMESNTKRIVRTREVGFDPSEKDQTIKCNLWGGWPTQDKQGDCDTTLELLWHLCSGETNAQEVYDWVLKWLAYPIQHPGAKMKTALVFHGPQGVGKNIFFEAIMAIYGEYGRIIDQAAVEDKFNDWASRKLFLIADEVVARAELWHTKNKLKGIITGEWIRINPKNMGAYDERNHVNMVFLSNETKPIVLERDDRRYAVVWTPAKLDPAFYETVRVELEGGGLEALHWFLKNLPLGEFKPWTLPPMTSAKMDLLEASMDSTERFWLEYTTRLLPLPLGPIRSEDLFEAYRFWCLKTNSKPPNLNTFVSETAKRTGTCKLRRRHYVGQSGTTTQQSTVIFPPGSDLAVEIRELTDSIDGFKDSVKAWKASDAQHGGAA